MQEEETGNIFVLENKKNYRERTNEIRSERDEKINIFLQEMNNIRTDLMEMKEQVNVMYGIVNKLKDEMREKQRREYGAKRQRESKFRK